MDSPDLYSSSNTTNQASAYRVLEAHLDFLQWEENEKIVDIGCGDGKVTFDCIVPILPNNFNELIAIDVSPSAISFAKNRNTNKKIDFSVFDIGSRNLPPHLINRFHHAFSFYCLHWVHPQKQAFQNIFDMLKPGGQAFITYVFKTSFFEEQEKLMKSDKWKSYFVNLERFIPLHLHATDPREEFKTLLEEIGFSFHFSCVNVRLCTFSNSSQFESFSRSINRFIKYVPDNEKNDYVKSYIKQVRKDKDTIIQTNGKEEKIEVKYKEMVLLISKPKI